jgi:hypothetical protein
LSEITDERVGGQERIYTSSAKQWENIIGAFKVLHWLVVMEYDKQGNWLGVRAVLSQPTFASIEQLWDVDESGNIYWLDFKVDHLEVMMAPVPKE